MARRSLTLAPLAPALAIIAFAAAKAATETGAPARNALEDVQIGEAGALLRVALICRRDCAVAARAGGVFYLAGVEADLDVDLAGRSRLARALEFRPVDGGAALTIRADRDVVRASIKPCRIDGGPASCIDLEYAAKGAGAPPRAASAGTDPGAEKSAKAAPIQAAGETAPAVPAPAIAAAPPPPLREAPGERMLTFARFAPPERLAPPAPATLISPGAPLRDHGSAAPARRPVIDKERARELLKADVDIADAAAKILGRSFGAGECEGAKARLRRDAWALDAMVDVGFCAAAAGDLEAADGLFSRLLAYTPDNYEALVGRALIAAKAGEKSVARKYFQDALNAAPPIEESDRIVEAMTQL